MSIKKYDSKIKKEQKKDTVNKTKGHGVMCQFFAIVYIYYNYYIILYYIILLLLYYTLWQNLPSTPCPALCHFYKKI